MHRFPFTALLLVGVLGSASLPAMAAEAAVPAAHGCHHRGHGNHHHSAFFRALHQLDLNDAQKQTLRADFKAARGTLKPQWQALRSARETFNHTMPGSAGYASAQAALEQASTTMLQARIQMQVRLREKAVGILSDAQRAHLVELLSSSKGG